MSPVVSSPNPASTITDKSVFDWRRIPPRFRGKSLDGFVTSEKPDPRSETIKALQSGQGVFITGAPGTGKTHLAVASLAAYIPTLDKVAAPGKFILQDVGFALLSSSEFFLELKASFSIQTGEMEILSRLTAVKILLFDDVGAEKVTDWSRQMFYTLIDRRYRNMAQTIITSNLSLQQLAESIDDRISSRISEMCKVITLTGKDFRIR